MGTLMTGNALRFTALFALAAAGTLVSVTACDRKGPVTPETSSTAEGISKGLPAPAAGGTAGSITGTPTDNGALALPPVTRIPGNPNAPVSSTPVAVVQPLPTTPAGTPRAAAPVPGAGPVAAVIGADSSAEPTVDDAKRVIEDYYAAVNRGAYDKAYRMWAANGQASGKSLRDFSNGYADTSSVSVSLGDPGPVDAGAGQRHIVVPVRIIARQRDQSTKEYSGTYTLARTVVDGASAAQRNWHISAANIDTAR